jgi:hypothetical protein
MKKSRFTDEQIVRVLLKKLVLLFVRIWQRLIAAWNSTNPLPLAA